MPQQSKVEASRSVLRARRSRPELAARRRTNAAHVVVAWTPAHSGETLGLEPTRVELEAELEAPTATWVCREPSDSGWAEALSAARCSEVSLTALGGDHHSRHLVFELAGLLTLKLAATRPLIRVRFLAPAELATRGTLRSGTG